MSRGVIQGDIISSIFFILALDQLIQVNDNDSKLVKCDRILQLKVFGYADDVAVISGMADEMTNSFSKIAHASLDDADMHVNMAKTFTHHVYHRENISVTEAEVAAVEADYGHKCNFCIRPFKTETGMLIHRAQYIHNYNTTNEVFELEGITGVFGPKNDR